MTLQLMVIFNISNTSTVALSNIIAADDVSNVYSATINGRILMPGRTFFPLQNTLVVSNRNNNNLYLQRQY